VASNEPENWRQLRYALYILFQRDEAAILCYVCPSDMHAYVHTHNHVRALKRTGMGIRVYI